MVVVGDAVMRSVGGVLALFPNLTPKKSRVTTAWLFPLSTVGTELEWGYNYAVSYAIVGCIRCMIVHWTCIGLIHVQWFILKTILICI